MPRIRSSGVPTSRQSDSCNSQPSVGYGFMFTIWQTAAGREGLLRVDYCPSRQTAIDPLRPPVVEIVNRKLQGKNRK